MPSSLSSLTNNLAKGFHKNKCKNCKSYLEYMKVKDASPIFKCLNCNKNYEKEFNEDLIEHFENTYRFCDGDINKFCRMLLKVVSATFLLDYFVCLNDSTCETRKNAFYFTLKALLVLEIINF